jgi:hypothetical protein
MGPGLIALVGMIYLFVAGDMMLHRQWPLAVLYLSFSLGNAALYAIAVQGRT